MCGEGTVLDLIGLIYDAAANLDLWSVFLERFADVVSGACTQIILINVFSQKCNLAASVCFDPTFEKQYNDHYAELDYWGIRGKPLCQTRNVLTSHTICPDEDLAKSAFPNDVLRHTNAFHILATIVLREDSLVGFLTSLRPKSAPAFGESETSLLKTLTPHLHRALQLHGKISRVQADLAAQTDVFNHLPFGVIMVNEKAEVLQTNTSAEALIHQQDGLRIGPKGLYAARPQENIVLRQFIRNAAMTGVRRGRHPGGTLSLSRPSHRRPLAVMVVPLSSRGNANFLGGLRAAAAIFVNDQETEPEGNEEALGRLYGLTPAEARLATILMQGKSLQEAAEKLELSFHTVRNQLKMILEKTGTHRQGELLRLLLTSPASLRTV